MPSYLIMVREGPIKDQAAYTEYATQVRAMPPADVPPRTLAAYGKLEAVDGAAPDGVVIMEFPTSADARAWYAREGYQQAREHRLRAADYRGFIVEGL